MSERPIRVEVNGATVAAEVEPRLLLVHFLRWVAGLAGTRIGCDTTSCGACTVLLDGRAVKSCTVFAVQADGRAVTTIEGLAPAAAERPEPAGAVVADAPLHPLQEAFWAKHGLQCGYCTPGLIMAATNLVDERRDDLSDDDIREAISGNLCRCTGYVNVVAAIRHAAELTRAGAATREAAP